MRAICRTGGCDGRAMTRGAVSDLARRSLAVLPGRLCAGLRRVGPLVVVDSVAGAEDPAEQGTIPPCASSCGRSGVVEAPDLDEIGGLDLAAVVV